MTFLRFLLPVSMGVCLSAAGFGQNAAPSSQAPVVLQPLSQLVTDIKSSSDAPAPQTKQAVAGDLAAIAQTEQAVDPDRILPPEEELARLRALPVSSVPLKNARLDAAIIALADESRMNYIAPAQADFTDRVKMTIRLNPKEMLDVLAESFGFACEYDTRGVWHFYKINPNELVTESFKINYNTLSRIQISAPSINQSLTAMSAGMLGGQPKASSDAGSSPFQQADNLIRELKVHLSVPTNLDGVPAYDGSVPGRRASMKTVDAPDPRITWHADTSELLATCTRQQMGIIRWFLKKIDQPQRRIRIAVKFVETARDPRRDLGVDWSGSPLGSGGAFALSGGDDPTSRISTPIDLAHPGSSFKLPKAVLSAPSFQLTLNALATDKFSHVTEDPVMVTTNNREVIFRATTQQPVKQGTTSLGSATTATSSSIVYLEIGPKLAIFPSILPGSKPGREQVNMAISIETSTIVGEKIIGNEPYPIMSSKQYQYSVPVVIGDTLAIAGLDERVRETDEKKVPFFGDIPVFGRAFKSTSERTTTTTLVAFITPTIEETDVQVPSTVATEIPKSGRRIFEGSPSETIEQLRASLQGLEGDIAALQKSADATNKDVVINRLDRLEVELGLMDARLAEWAALDAGVDHSAENGQVAQLKKALSDARGVVGRIAATKT